MNWPRVAGLTTGAVIALYILYCIFVAVTGGLVMM